MSNNATENIMDTSAGNATETVVPTVELIDQDDIYSFQCAKVVRDSMVTDVDLIFYVDLAYPVGTEAEEAGIRHLQTGLVDSVSKSYEISSGIRCSDPPFDGTSWLVRFTSDANDYTRVAAFGKCKHKHKGNCPLCHYSSLTHARTSLLSLYSSLRFLSTIDLE
jgi:hypothetical protein